MLGRLDRQIGNPHTGPPGHKPCAGFPGYLDGVAMGWILLAGFTRATVAGSPRGTQSCWRTSPTALKKALAGFPMGIATYILFRGVPGL